jgi:peroxiredoxin
MKRRVIEVCTVLVAFLLSASLYSQKIAKHWAGTATIHGQQVPIRLDLNVEDALVRGEFLNGDEKSVSSSGELHGTHLVLNFDYFARKLEGDLNAQGFVGTFGGGRSGTPVPVELKPESYARPTAELKSSAAVPEISGDWEIAVKSPKGESAWTLRISPYQGKAKIKAVILRIDGDTGGLYGGFDAGLKEFRVSRFAASGSTLYSLKPQENGTLLVTNDLREGQSWTARRSADARKEQLAPPTRATEQTSVVDPSKPLQFSAHDLNGQPVSNADARFKNKVVIVAIGGSWCPNCHDEAPFLVELYRRYHSRGLEIVELSFEEEEQLKNPIRLHAFTAKYRIPFPVLIAGTPDQLAEKLPQGKNLNCWPTSFFIGRDGLVKETHAGFSGPATGRAYVDLKSETKTLLEKLLSEN